MKVHYFCPHCGRPVQISHNDKEYNGYSFQCYNCDEDFFRFEVLTKKEMGTVKALRKYTEAQRKTELQ